MADPLFKPDVIFFIFRSGQVTDLHVISKPLQYHKMPQLHNAVNDSQSFSGRCNFQKVRSPRYSLYNSDFSCRWSQVRSVTWPRPLEEILKMFILQQKWYNWNSDASSIIFMHSCHVSVPYFCIFDLVWRHRWRHMSRLGHQHFSSITSDQIEKENRERHHRARTELPNRLMCDLIHLA